MLVLMSLEPLMLIGNYKTPYVFLKNIKKYILPVTYANQKNAWMNSVLFLTGFITHLYKRVSRSWSGTQSSFNPR